MVGTEEIIGCKDLKYEMTETVKEIDDIGPVTVYGVLVCRSGHEKSGDETKCCRLADISSKKEVVQGFLQKLSEGNVSPINVEECLEDFCSI